ncbi:MULTISPECIES: iron-sulfur cluster-binding domain-containing protein [Prauserella salsuginis group]|uniref:2Fe-2S iron-sulfur cluster-binding protein n=1 Tax=Prauserella salsuginis TaxID=387889 RepID=A0ABW6G7P9_9PSEU|nr:MULTISPECIES: iron-sulfur cluster-binding domain-containing protein [Prauserella salsuginis group]MCR3719598.1 3-ketosteroid 9alpha-monooxygenase subunit B [Prauserella flava]MCR3735388.1 3-ketosteroid 9alpha-monooxygenase subunit B [Prauserella salsuginis]
MRTEPLIPVRITGVVDESADVKTFTLEPTTADVRLSHAAGQFLTLKLPVDGQAPITRTYSISSCPVTDRRLAVTVKRAAGGVGSNWLYEDAAVGTVLHTYPPAGAFTLDPSDRVVHLFAAGVGITPIISLCKFALASTDRPALLHYTVRDHDDAPFLEDIRLLERAYPGRLAVEVHASDERGRLNASTIRSVTEHEPNPVSYVCGPDGYTRLVVDTLTTLGRPADAIRTESFGPSPVAGGEGSGVAGASGTDRRASTARVRLDGAETVIPWPADTPLIDALDAAGIAAPSSCRQGECLTCECRIVAGNASMRRNNVLDDEDIACGYALACQLIPHDSDVTVAFS